MRTGRSTTTIVIQTAEGGTSITCPGTASVVVIHNKDLTEDEMRYAMEKENSVFAHMKLWRQMHPGNKSPMSITPGPRGCGQRNIL